MRTLHALSVMLAATALAGCEVSTGPADQRVVGIVEMIRPTFSAAAPGAPATAPQEEPVLEAPDTVTAGVSFDVVVRTYGTDGCWREAGAEVATTGMAVSITPHDRHDAGPGVMCTQALVRLPRTVRATLSQRGQGTIRVSGRKVRLADGTLSEQGSVTVEKRVVVR